VSVAGERVKKLLARNEVERVRAGTAHLLGLRSRVEQREDAAEALREGQDLRHPELPGAIKRRARELRSR
jgi:hypothetical protein